MQLQKELRTHNPPKDSTHVYYSHTKYELQTPTGSGRTRIHVFFSVFSTIFRWFIKETLSKCLCKSVNFEQKITEKHTQFFLDQVVESIRHFSSARPNPWSLSMHSAEGIPRAQICEPDDV